MVHFLRFIINKNNNIQNSTNTTILAKSTYHANSVCSTQSKNTNSTSSEYFQATWHKTSMISFHQNTYQSCLERIDRLEFHHHCLYCLCNRNHHRGIYYTTSPSFSYCTCYHHSREDCLFFTQIHLLYQFYPSF